MFSKANVLGLFLTFLIVADSSSAIDPATVISATKEILAIGQTLFCFVDSLNIGQSATTNNGKDLSMAMAAVSKVYPMVALTMGKLKRECNLNPVGRKRRSAVDFICSKVEQNQNKKIMSELSSLKDASHALLMSSGETQEMIRNLHESLFNLNCGSIRQHVEMVDALAQLGFVVDKVQESLFLESDSINNKLNSFSNQFRSIIADVNRDMHLDKTQEDLLLINRNAKAYQQRPNDVILGQLRIACQSIPSSKVTIQIKNRFSSPAKVRDFYTNLEFSHANVENSLKFMKYLVDLAAVTRVSCLSVDENFSKNDIDNQLQIASQMADIFQNETKEIDQLLQNIQLPTLIQYIAEENYYQKTVEDFTTNYQRSKSNREIADGLRQVLQEKFGFIGVKFLVVALNNGGDPTKKLCFQQVTKLQQSSPWQGSIWHPFGRNQAIYVMWNNCNIGQYNLEMIKSSSSNLTAMSNYVRQSSLGSLAIFHFTTGQTNSEVSQSDVERLISISHRQRSSIKNWKDNIQSNQCLVQNVDIVEHWAVLSSYCPLLDRLKTLYPKLENRCDSGKKCSQLFSSKNGNCKVNVTRNSLQILKGNVKGKL